MGTKSIGEWALKYEESPAHLAETILNDAELDLGTKHFGDLLWLLIRRMSRKRSNLIDKQEANEQDLRRLQETDYTYRETTRKSSNN